MDDPLSALVITSWALRSRTRALRSEHEATTRYEWKELAAVKLVTCLQLPRGKVLLSLNQGSSGKFNSVTHLNLARQETTLFLPLPCLHWLWYP